MVPCLVSRDSLRSPVVDMGQDHSSVRHYIHSADGSLAKLNMLTDASDVTSVYSIGFEYLNWFFVVFVNKQTQHKIAILRS